MFTITSFFTSAILIALLLVLKRTELRKGVRFFESTRQVLDEKAVVFFRFTFYTLPRKLAKFFRYVIIQITDLFGSSLLQIVQFVEGKLQRFVRSVRRVGRVGERKEPSSSYFKEVSEHRAQARNGDEKHQEVQ